MVQSLAAYRSGLPPLAAEGLAKGSVGAQHLMRLSSLLLARVRSPQEHAFELRLAGELLFAAWEANPLNSTAALQILRLEGGLYKLTPECRNVVSFTAGHWQPPTDTARLDNLAREGETDALAALMDEGLSREPRNLYWLHQAWNLAQAEGRLDWFAAHLSRQEHRQQPLLRFVAGCLLLAQSGGDDAESHAQHGAAQALPIFRDLAAEHRPRPNGEGLPPALHWSAPAEMYAHCLALCGDLSAARCIWAEILSSRPWHSNLALRLHDATLKDTPDLNPLLNNTALLLYSFNKADDLAATLRAVAPSASLFRKILVLDNGSSDATAALLRNWQAELGADLFEPVFLPVNVGAPAARNWLAGRPEVAACEYALYLDDDALVATGAMPDVRAWLKHLALAVGRYPQAAVWGLKIRDHQLPWQAQSVDLHVEPNIPGSAGAAAPAAQFSLTSALTYPFAVSGLHTQAPDFGQFSYTRPCVSVTGCCHLMRSRDLQGQGPDQGGFNLVFSPSQYDDLERDLRLAVAGRHVCYHGHFSVRHLKRTGKGAHMSRAQYGNGLANSYKLAGRFTPEELSGLFAFQDALLQDDLQRKLERLDELWPDLAD